MVRPAWLTNEETTPPRTDDGFPAANRARPDVEVNCCGRRFVARPVEPCANDSHDRLCQRTAAMRTERSEGDERVAHLKDRNAQPGRPLDM